MGILLSKIYESIAALSEREAKIVMVGLDAAGKTTILYKMKLGEVITTTPTIGFNVEKFKYKNLTMTCWDIGGQDILRGLWHHYYSGVDAIIFCVDSNDTERIPLAKAELNKILGEHQLKEAAILVYANKQDLPRAISTTDIMNGLELKHHSSNPWFVQGCSGLSGDGLYEGLEWLNGTLKKRKS